MNLCHTTLLGDTIEYHLNDDFGPFTISVTPTGDSSEFHHSTKLWDADEVTIEIMFDGPWWPTIELDDLNAVVQEAIRLLTGGLRLVGYNMPEIRSDSGENGQYNSLSRGYDYISYQIKNFDFTMENS